MVVDTPALSWAGAAICLPPFASILPRRCLVDKIPDSARVRGNAAYSPPVRFDGSASLVHAERMDPSWPPVLIGLVVILAVGAIIVVTTMFRTLRGAAREERLRPRGFRR